MHPRTDVVALFSTFLQLDQQAFQGWISSPKLRRSMEQCLDQVSETSDQFWARYWHNHWETHSSKLAREHLSAYLQEPAYWAAYHIISRFANFHYSLGDCFQIAIAEVDTVLTGFNPEQNTTLKGYARAIFNSSIKGTLRQRQETDICSDWGLLRKLSQKRVSEALQQQGFSSTTITDYILVWHCFNQIYVPKPGQGTRRLTKPDPDTWSAIAQCYYHKQGQHQPEQVLEQWLLQLAKAARSYLYPTVRSGDQPVSEDDDRTLVETLPDCSTPMNDLISAEQQQTRQQQYFQMSHVLYSAITQLDTKQQMLLSYYYAQGYTQKQIAQTLETKQYTVSRQLNKIRKTLVQALAEWSQQTLHISLSSNLLKEMSSLLEEWLTHHYAPTDELATPVQEHYHES